MESTIVVAILSLVGTLGGSIIAGIVSNNKTLYRIEQLERKVEKHNSVVERVAIAENTLKSQQHQIDELKGICKMINWKVRMRNPMFWAQILLSVIMPILAYLGLTAEDLSSWSVLGEVLIKAVSSPYILSLVIVSVYNAITDPTTTGFTDSKRALTYDTPNSDKE